ncbi:MAG: cobalamin B12-binding domain-containing protein [Chloroflexi bacterium]|nr:cobalamin B12-binding domain-containing protein [Chloroflexota bacterium]
MTQERPLRVLVAKPGLDGHDRGAKVIVRALRDAGMEVIYTGLRQTPDQIVRAALQEDVDVIGLSILSGAHQPLTARLSAKLREAGLGDVMVVVGGTVPPEDVEPLLRAGAGAVFPTGSRLEQIVAFLRAHGPRRQEAPA